MPRPLRNRRLSPLAALAGALVAALAAGAATVAAAPADHLILSEINLQTRIVSASQRSSAYIELINPTAAAIDLSDVYLTDATTSPSTYYYDVVLRGGAGGGGTGNDFHARFPDGASIAAGDTIVIALRGTDVTVAGTEGYQYVYGRLPDYELYEDGLAPDEVPELVEVFPGSIGRGLGSTGTNAPELATGGETVVLYRWDGQSDLVEDLDYAIWGTLTSVRTDKSTISRDGPDDGETPSVYANDTSVLTQQPIATSAHSFLNSFQRRDTNPDFDEGAEPATGGNGATGHNETGEPLASTWIATLAQTPPLAPAAGTLPAPPAPIVTAAVLDPLDAYADQTITVRATVLAYDAVAAVSLFWSDGGAFTEVAATSAGGNVWAAPIPGRAVGTTVRWYLRATGSGGGVSVKPAAAPVYTNSYTVQPAPVYPPLLLITEVCTLSSPLEFIEIANPTGAEVDLSNYYLTDAVHAPGDQYYWQIVRPNPGQTTVGGGLFNDFHARFPAGAKIAAGDTITIAVAGSDAFSTGYQGLLPDFELYEESAPANVDTLEADDVPNMRMVFPGSIRGSTLPTLTDITGTSTNGEIVVLYYWDGQSDLVTDIDLFVWGSSTSTRFNKAGVSIDGPDADTTPSTYKADTAPGSWQSFPSAHAFGESYTRIDGTEGTETKTGGNGTLGHNETSENLGTTFAAATASPSPPGGAQAGGGGVALEVPARTFLPRLGESFPVRFRSKPGCVTEVRIFDLHGRHVVTLFDSRFDGAAATAEGRWTERAWNGRDREYELVPAGTYVAHLSVTDRRSGKSDTQTAPVVVATRLSD